MPELDPDLAAVLAFMLPRMEFAIDVRSVVPRLLSDELEDFVADRIVDQMEERSIFIGFRNIESSLYPLKRSYELKCCGTGNRKKKEAHQEREREQGKCR